MTWKLWGRRKIIVQVIYFEVYFHVLSGKFCLSHLLFKYIAWVVRSLTFRKPQAPLVPIHYLVSSFHACPFQALCLSKHQLPVCVRHTVMSQRAQTLAPLRSLPSLHSSVPTCDRSLVLRLLMNDPVCSCEEREKAAPARDKALSGIWKELSKEIK